ncbi:MAG: hypothetical protein IPK16_26195 [Anaerolineales bacterium]|nr:hypothetical protein [Anaerolineales bacterium]
MSQTLHVDTLSLARVPSAGSIEADNLQHQTWRGYGLLAILLLVTAVTLMGCSSSPKMTATDVSCDIISGKTFSGLFERWPENMAVYLDKAFATTVEEASQPITTTSGVVQESYYDWNSEIGAYQLSTFDRRPRYVHLTTGDEGPTLGRVIECLGAPTQYSMRYGSAGDSRPFIVGELFYTDKGVIVRIRVPNSEIEDTSNSKNVIRAVNNATPVRPRMQWVESGRDIETMNWRAALYEWQPDEMSGIAFTQQNLAYYSSFRPWPGALDKVELTYIAPHLLPASGVESPLQPTRVP